MRYLPLSMILTSYILANHITLDDITVTASKMEEDIKNVPQSITVLDDIYIEERRIHRVSQAVRDVPNMHAINSIAKTMVNFRGINMSKFTDINTVTLYIDGVPQSDIQANYNAFLGDVERIEILRGPQSSLYGMDSIGGVINVKTKAPSNEWHGQVGQELGNNRYSQTSLSARGALIDDKLFLNLSGVYDRDDGWITNHYNGQNDKKANFGKHYRFNTILTAKPTDKFTASLSFSADKSKDGFFKGGVGRLKEMSPKKAKHANYDVPSQAKVETKSSALNLEYEFDAMKLTSLTTYKRSSIQNIHDLDFLSGNKVSINHPVLGKRLMFADGETRERDFNLQTWTQEVRLNSINNKDSMFDWVAGLYYDNTKQDRRKFGGVRAMPNQKIAPFPSKFDYFYLNEPSIGKTNTIAAFGQLNITPMDNLTFNIGGRLQRYEAKTDYKNRLPDREDSWNKFLPKLGVIYNINDDLSVFANYSMGYLAGGHNYFAKAGDKIVTFEPQTSDNYEIGLRYIGSDLKASVTAFYMDIDDIHTFDNIQVIGSQDIRVVSNAGKARSYGLEVEASYALTNNLYLNGSFGYVNAEYRQDNKAENVKKGNKISYTPNWNASLGLSYAHPTGLYGRVDLNALGDIYWDNSNDDEKKTSSYLTADVRLGYMFDNGLDIYGFVTNITDKDAPTLYMPYADVIGDYSLVEYGNTRRFGVGFSYTF
ncbi:MAG: TonB-dependent receptor [Campylobacteraceae bacterium]|nr:TonB-dependent receptor [Campylobacteraceae bacterium]